MLRNDSSISSCPLSVYSVSFILALGRTVVPEEELIVYFKIGSF